MFSGNRLFSAAVGGFLAGFLWAGCALAQPPEGFNVAKDEPTSNAAPSNKPENQKNQPTSTPEKAIPVKQKTAAGDGSDIGRPESYYKEQDLKAQQEMARATDGIVRLTKWQIGLGVAGTIFLLWTLCETRSATKLASETAKHQLRAYITFGGAKLEWTSRSSFKIYMVFKNSGQTPAFGLHNLCGITIGEPQSKDDLMETPEAPHDEASVCDVGAGMPITLGSSSPEEVDMEVYNSIVDLKVPIYAVGEVRYKDIFGKCTRRTKYRIVRPVGDTEFYPCKEGNYST